MTAQHFIDTYLWSTGAGVQCVPLKAFGSVNDGEDCLKTKLVLRKM